MFDSDRRRDGPKKGSRRWRTAPRQSPAVGHIERERNSHWPARLDLAQSASGLLLALFMWVHMVFVSSILISKDAMWTITKFFEGYFFFGTSYPWIVSIVVAVVIALVRHPRHACGT